MGCCGGHAWGPRVGPGRPGRGESPHARSHCAAQRRRQRRRGAAEWSARRWSRGLRTPAPASARRARLPSAAGAPRLLGPTRRQVPERESEGDGARRPARAPHVPEPRGTAGQSGVGRGAAGQGRAPGRPGCGRALVGRLGGRGIRLQRGERRAMRGPRPSLPPPGLPTRSPQHPLLLARVTGPSVSESLPSHLPGHGQRSDPAARGRLPPTPGD